MYPPTKNIYLIRHGETEQNKNGIIQGSSIDSDLNQTGRLQARAFYEAYREVPFEKIYISALKRTYQSVEPFIQAGVPYEVLPTLNELNWGPLEGVHFHSERGKDYQQLLAEWQKGNIEFALPGGETPVDAAKRLQAAWQYILSKNEEQNVLVCLHGRVLRILLTIISQAPLHDMDQFQHRNLCLYRVTHHRGISTIVEQNTYVDIASA